MKVHAVWKFVVESNVFMIPIQVTNPRIEKTVEVICLFDTGFSGYLGLDEKSVKKLELQKLGEAYALSAGGTIKFENYSGVATIITKDNKIVGEIFNQEREKINKDPRIIPIQKFHIAVLGMKAIRLFHWLLLPDKELLLMVD
jgi:predicted aspartyl protease